MEQIAPRFMRANVLEAPGRFGIAERPIPTPGPGEAVIRVRLTTISDADIEILRGGFPSKLGLTLGQEATGSIHSLGVGVSSFAIGDRVLASVRRLDRECLMDGAQAEYLRVADAEQHLAPIPDLLTDHDVLMLADVASSGFCGAECAGVRLADHVAVFGQGPVGLCATLGARLLGAARIFAVDHDHYRLEAARRFGATDPVIDDERAVTEILRAAGGPVDAVIDASPLGAVEQGLAVLREGGTLSRIGGVSSRRQAGFDAASEGKNVVRAGCPCGRERMTRLMRMVEAERIDLTPLLTHEFRLEQIRDAYALFGQQRDNVLKVAILVS